MTRMTAHTARTLLMLFAISLVTPIAAVAGELRPVKGEVTAGDFIVMDLLGRPMRFSTLAGKVVLLNFWATWCPPCREEMPSMEQLHQAYKAQGLVVVALSQDQASADRVRAYLNEIRVTFPVWHDRDRLVARQYSVPGVPASYLIARDGRIAYRVFGEYEWSAPEARAAVEMLLGAGAAR